MTQNNRLTLAVAGSGKTESIIRECANLPRDERVLILTFTTNNQLELRSRLLAAIGERPNVEVAGWFAFLLARFARPFLPFVFRGKRIHGFDFESPPQQRVPLDEYRRYFTKDGRARKVHLPQLALRIENAASGAGIRTLERLYDRIYVDEVQDLGGYDLDILELLMRSRVPLSMVGDVRQAILATNPQEPRNRKYLYLGIWDWFREHAKKNTLVIEQQRSTWRCHPDVAAFADQIFDASHGFESTVSQNTKSTPHDGIFLLAEKDVPQYQEEYSPLFLRHSASSAKGQPYDFVNIGASKGMSRERVLIWSTARIADYLLNGKRLENRSASALYVAVTRARQSVAFVVPKPRDCAFPVWTPSAAD